MANAIRAPAMDAVEKAKSGHPGMPMGTAPRIAVEAGVQFGWERWLGPRSAIFGMTGFGASAPGEALFPHFGITPKRLRRQPARSYRSTGLWEDESWRYGLASTALAASAG
jgi:transketolase